MAKVLIADDNKDIVIVLRDFVEALGHTVRTELDGLQAGLQAKEWKPDVLVADVQMPNFYGTTALVSLQESPETAVIPVLFISAIDPATVETMLKGVRANVRYPERVRFVPKPIDFPLFERTLNELLAFRASDARTRSR